MDKQGEIKMRYSIHRQRGNNGIVQCKKWAVREQMKLSLKNQRTICLMLFVIYVLFVLRLTVFRFGVYSERQLNLTLFTDLINVYRYSGIARFMWLFLGNIGWFIPFGFLLPMLLKKSSLLKIVACGFMFSFAIETTQFFTYKGVAELDDLILNTLGVAIGYLLFKLLSMKGLNKIL